MSSSRVPTHLPDIVLARGERPKVMIIWHEDTIPVDKAEALAVLFQHAPELLLFVELAANGVRPGAALQEKAREILTRLNKKGVDTR